MPDPTTPESQLKTENAESFADILSQYEQTQSRKADDGSRRLVGTVITVKEDSVFLDIGFKTEGVLPLAVFESSGEAVKPGDKISVSVKGRNEEGYYELTRFRVERPTDWTSLEQAFTSRATIIGAVTGVVKGGLTVDVGVRAFMPASRSGVKEAAEMEKLVGQEIRCRITKLDVTEEDVVVDRRIVAEEEERAVKERRFSEINEGDTVRGEVRTLTDYGAFIDLGGVDGLLHVSDISWGRISKPADVLSQGQQVEARVLKIDPAQRRISLGLKQLQPHPWEAVPERYKIGDRVRGAVTRIVDFGAFVELEPGIEGLIHISELSWTRRVKRVSEVLKQGETIEAVILGVSTGDRRIALGLKQTLGDPWADVLNKFSVGSVIEGPVTNITKFGAFVQLAEGIEGMVHVSDISAEKRINHPQDVLKVGQAVKAQVLAVDSEKRQVRLGMKQMLPTSLDEYIADHKSGDVVTGRILDITGDQQVELGEGIHATCQISSAPSGQQPSLAEGKADLSSLSSMLKARWKGGDGGGTAKPEPVRAGQVRNFKITKLDTEGKKIQVELSN